MHINQWRWTFVCFLLVACAHELFAAPPVDAMDRTRIEKMLADGDTGMIVQVFKRYPGHTLPFIDQYFEGGLARIEKGEDLAAVLDQFRTGIRFAELADKAFGGQAFSEYANSFASWSAAEQKIFREGQKAFKEGMKDPNSAAGRESLERSLELAESLGDLWGQAMAKLALAEAALSAGENELALAYAMQAVELNAKLQLKADCAQSFVAAARAAQKTDQPVSSVSYYSQAWTLIERDPDIAPEFRESTFTEFAAVMEKHGMKDRADALRPARAKSQQSKTPSQAPPKPN